MIQLIIGGVQLPETSSDKYQCYEDKLSKSLEMISGRTVTEVRGKVWVAEYSYDYMGNALCRQLLAVLRSGKSFVAQVLTDNSDTSITSTFVCTDLTPPSFAFSRAGVGLWHDIKFKIREVTPHD